MAWSGLNLVGFAVLFALHVVFAAGGMELAFSIVAVLMSLQVFTFGPLAVVLERPVSRAKRRQTNRAAALVALPLASDWRGRTAVWRGRPRTVALSA